MKRKKFLTPDATIDGVTSKLVELGYKCLSNTDLNRRYSIEKNMVSMHSKCFYCRKKTGCECNLYGLYVCSPSEKAFVELDFTLMGEIVLEKTKTTIGKVMYINEKAVQLAEKTVFEK